MSKLDQEQKMLALLAGGIGFIGIVLSLINPVLGFLITGSTIVLTVAALIIDLKKEISSKLPNFKRSKDLNAVTIGWGVLALLSLTLMVINQIYLVVGTLILIFGLVRIYGQGGLHGKATEKNWTEFLVTLLIAGVFYIVYLIPQILLVPVVLTFGAFIFTLLPEKTQKEIINTIDNK